VHTGIVSKCWQAQENMINDRKYALIGEARSAGRNASLDESNGKRLLTQFGIRGAEVGGGAGGRVAHGQACRPQLAVVVKVMSPDILHKSDAGGVRVNLQDAQLR
jgi:acyl-CoA synthetase (NDP forming)